MEWRCDGLACGAIFVAGRLFPQAFIQLPKRFAEELLSGGGGFQSLCEN
jgi:hypothetical protein